MAPVTLGVAALLALGVCKLLTALGSTFDHSVVVVSTVTTTTFWLLAALFPAVSQTLTEARAEAKLKR